MQCSPFDSSLPATQVTVTTEEEKKKKGELIKVIELCQEEDLAGGFVFVPLGIWGGCDISSIQSWKVLIGSIIVAKTEFEKVLSIHIYSLAPVPLKVSFKYLGFNTLSYL